MLNTDQKILFEILIKLKEKLSIAAGLPSQVFSCPLHRLKSGYWFSITKCDPWIYPSLTWDKGEEEGSTRREGGQQVLSLPWTWELDYQPSQKQVQTGHNCSPSLYENPPKDVPPPMGGEVWIRWVVRQRMIGRPDPDFGTCWIVDSSLFWKMATDCLDIGFGTSWMVMVVTKRNF